MTTSKSFLANGSGMFGNRNKSERNSLADLAQSTQFPQWNTMTKRQTTSRSDLNTRGGDIETHKDDGNFRKIAADIPINQTKVYRDRRCSDTSLLERKLKEKESTFSPSHYKGSRRGTYAAVYDPRVTQTRPRADTRSRSLFIHAADEQLSNPDLRIQLLKSFHKHRDSTPTENLSSDSESSSSSNNDDTMANSYELKKHKKKKCQKKHRLLSSVSIDHQNTISTNSSSYANRFRKERALSTFQNLSKEHVQYLQNKQQQQQQDSINTNSGALSPLTYSEDDGLPAIHRAAKYGNIDDLSKLIEQGHDVNEVDSQNNLPCYYALLNGHFDCVALLVSQGADLQDYFARQRSKYFK